jgi:hypothetical protein
LRSLIPFILLYALTTAQGQDRHDWQSLARLNSGDQVRMVLKTGPVSGTFQSWTGEALTVGTVTARREDVLKIERYRHSGSRGKHAAIGALIGFGGGFAIGAGVTGDCKGSIGPCIPRHTGGLLAGGAGAVIGAVVGACLPAHRKELIYSAR